MTTTMKGKGAGKARKGTGRGKRPEALARDARDIRCGSCGRTGHSSAECREPKRGPGERACFNCGELGHTAFRCPKAPAQRQPAAGARPVKALEDQAPPVINLNVLEPSGFEPVRRARRHGAERLRRRGPEANSVNSFCVNSFSVLASTDSADSDDEQQEKQEQQEQQEKQD